MVSRHCRVREVIWHWQPWHRNWVMPEMLRMPFQSLDDPDYELTVISQRNLSEVDMDRLSQLKFNPFQLSNDIALCGNSETSDTFFNMNQINCNYYLPSEFKEHTINNNLTNYFSLLHLNIRSISNRFDSFKHLLNSLNKPFQVIGLTETWLNNINN